LSLVVSDSAIGIGDTQRIWQSFEQEDATYNKRRRGSGLGLAIVRNIVELMNGKVTVASQLGQGTRFKVTIPAPALTTALARGNHQRDAHRYDLTRVKPQVLIVDDSPVNQLILSEMLSDLGYSFRCVSQAKDALKALDEQVFDVIFMDIHMPDMNGLELTQVIRSHSYTPQPHIIALTANAFDDMREASRQAGMNDYVTKPFLREHIIQALENYLA